MLMMMCVSCSRHVRQSTTEERQREMAMASMPFPASNNQFAFDLLQILPPGDENFVISPFSISAAMAMTYAGARGETKEQMARVMHFRNENSGFHQQYGEYIAELDQMAGDTIALNIANSLWAQEDYHFLDSFFELIESAYNSQTFRADFMADRERIRQNINDWVYEQTAENIDNLISRGVLTADTRLVLVNAIHFFGPWLEEFEAELTREDSFYVSPREQSQAYFMSKRDTFPYFGDENMQVLELPYAGGDFSMMVILPAEHTDLARVEESLDALCFFRLTRRVSPSAVELHLPRFDAESKVDLEETLTSMGMTDAFADHADFSGMTGQRDLKIDKVIHQAMIEVAEKGTEAAAATAVVAIRKSALEQDAYTIFNANRPFLFFIKDNEHQSILFAGRVMDPGAD